MVLTDGTLVLGYALTTVSIITETDDAVNGLADKLRTVLNSVPAGFQLQILRRSRAMDAHLLKQYREALKSKHPLLREQRSQAAAHLARQRLRVYESYFFLSRPKALVSAADVRGDVLSRLLHRLSSGGRQVQITRDRHAEVLEQLRQQAKLITQSLSATGVGLAPLPDDSFIRLAFAFLNPGREANVPQLTDARPPRVLPEKERPLFRALSLREQLVHCAASQSMDTLFLGEPLKPHRVLALKAMPKVTEAAIIRSANRIPFDHWLSLGLAVPDSEAKFDEVDKRRKRAQAWAAGAVRNIKADEQAAELEEALRAMESRDQRVFNLSLHLLFGADDVVELEHRSIQAVGSFQEFFTPLTPARMVQLPSFVGMLPGCAHLATHPRTVLTDNAAHFLPLYDAWQGDRAPVWLAATRNAEPFLVDIRDPRADAWNLNVFGRTGSGKSFFVLSQLTSAMLGQGSPVVIIDIGGAEEGSYYRLCKLLGGDFVDLSLDGSNAINPFYARQDLYITDKGQPSPTPNEGKLNLLLQLALLGCQDSGEVKRTRVGDRILREAILLTYERIATDRPPLFSDLAVTLAEHYRGEDPDDQEAARRYAKTLRAFLAGPAGKLLNQQTKVRLGSDFIIFDLKGMENLGDVATAMLYVVNAFVWNMIGKKDRSELAWVIYDETWKLMQHPTAAKLQEELYRTARKLRAGVVSVTQKLEDFLASPAAKAVLSNTIRTFLLRHKDGHRQVADLLGLNDIEFDLFKSLDTRKGFYSEVFLKTDERGAVLRYSAGPWDYWINTTDGMDKALEREVLPRFNGDRLAALRHLVATYPNGAAAGPVASTPSKKVPHAA